MILFSIISESDKNRFWEQEHVFAEKKNNQRKLNKNKKVSLFRAEWEEDMEVQEVHVCTK